MNRDPLFELDCVQAATRRDVVDRKKLKRTVKNEASVKIKKY